MTEPLTCHERQTELQLEYLLSTPSPLTPIALLKLGSCASFEEVSIHNMIGVMKLLSIFIFFAHPKHQKKLALLLVITQTEFISAHVITNECRQYLRSLTMSLQEEFKDIVQAVSEITTSSLKQIRENVDYYYYSRWYETVSKMCNEGRQCHRASIPAPNLSEYLEELSQFQFWTIFLNLTSGLVHIKKLLFMVHLVPPVLVTEVLATVSSVVIKVACNCVQHGDDESGGAICYGPPKCVFSHGDIHNCYPSGNLKRKIMVQIHFLQLPPQHFPESLLLP